jgi:two-component system sensor histidine kinase ChvG
MNLRSVQAAVAAGSLLLVALPLLLLGLAYGYERWLIARCEGRLRLAAEALLARPEVEAAAHSGVTARLIDRRGTVVADSGNEATAVEWSLLGGLAQRVLGGGGQEASARELLRVEAVLGPPGGRAEVQAALRGQASFLVRAEASQPVALFALAVPGPDGGAVYLTLAAQRGVRRLLVLRSELLKLTLYEVGFALLYALGFTHRVVRPLEALARAAQVFPSRPLADPELLRRKDEIGALARSLQALVQDLEARRQATADLGADIAHEFKNPLAVIATAAELFGGERPVAPETRQLVSASILTAVERLRRCIDDLLHLLRLEADVLDEPRSQLDYADYLDKVLGDYRLRYPQVRFRLEVGPGAAQVRIAPDRWAELLRNLLDNAVIQPMAQPEVAVVVRRVADGIETAVSDRGPGISAGNQEKIWQRFFTQRPPGVEPGTGLGLSIVQAVAKAHGAKVALASAAGAGATFRVTLPD